MRARNDSVFWVKPVVAPPCSLNHLMDAKTSAVFPDWLMKTPAAFSSTATGFLSRKSRELKLNTGT